MTSFLSALSLPDTVFFPGIFVVVHTSEAATLRQLDLATREGGYLCVVLPRERGPLSSCAIHSVGCVAQLVEVQRVAGGWNVKLVGLARARLTLEMQTNRGRIVQASPIPEVGPPRSEEWKALVADLRERARGHAGLPEAVANPDPRISESLWLDALAFHLSLNPATKQALLSEPRVLSRGRALSSLVDAKARTLVGPRLN